MGASQPGGHIEKLGDAFDLLAAYSEGGFLFERAGDGVAASVPIVATGTMTVRTNCLPNLFGGVMDSHSIKLRVPSR